MTARSVASDIELVNFIISYTETNGFPPSRRQMAEALGMSSVESAQKRIERLVREGVITRAPGVPRGIRVNRDRINQLGAGDGEG